MGNFQVRAIQKGFEAKFFLNSQQSSGIENK
jgi:hypothetical protein